MRSGHQLAQTPRTEQHHVEELGLKQTLWMTYRNGMKATYFGWILYTVFLMRQELPNYRNHGEISGPGSTRQLMRFHRLAICSCHLKRGKT